MQRILALLDFSSLTTAIVKMARDLARSLNCELVLMHVVESESEHNEIEDLADKSTHAVAARAHRRELEILILALKKEGINAVAQLVQAKSPHENIVGKILAEVARLSPDLVVVGSSGHGRLHQLLTTNVTDSIIRKANFPVLIVPIAKALEVG